mgnify:CR=1 FL=1
MTDVWVEMINIDNTSFNPECFWVPLKYEVSCLQDIDQDCPLELGLHFGMKKNGKMSPVFEDFSKNSVFFGTEVKPS